MLQVQLRVRLDTALAVAAAARAAVQSAVAAAGTKASSGGIAVASRRAGLIGGADSPNAARAGETAPGVQNKRVAVARTAAAQADAAVDALRAVTPVTLMQRRHWLRRAVAESVLLSAPVRAPNPPACTTCGWSAQTAAAVEGAVTATHTLRAWCPSCGEYLEPADRWNRLSGAARVAVDVEYGALDFASRSSGRLPAAAALIAAVQAFTRARASAAHTRLLADLEGIPVAAVFSTRGALQQTAHPAAAAGDAGVYPVVHGCASSLAVSDGTATRVVQLVALDGAAKEHVRAALAQLRNSHHRGDGSHQAAPEGVQAAASNAAEMSPLEARMLAEPPLGLQPSHVGDAIERASYRDSADKRRLLSPH
jgi:hypothetical protein